MTAGKREKTLTRAERMSALMETARLLHPHSGDIAKLLAATLSVPVHTVRNVLYGGRIVSHEMMDRWSLKLEAGIERDAEVAAERHARMRRALKRAQGIFNETVHNVIDGDPDEAGGAAI